MKARKRPPKRFAEGTKVPVHQSRADVEALLRKHGAHQIMSGSDSHKEMGYIAFALTKRHFKIRVDWAAKNGRASEADQREREGWRLLAMLVRARLELCRMGQSTPEVEFLANVVLPDGSTVGEQVLPRIAEAYDTGVMPALLTEGGGL